MSQLRALRALFMFFAVVGLLIVPATAGVISTYSGYDAGAGASDRDQTPIRPQALLTRPIRDCRSSPSNRPPWVRSPI